MEVQNTRILALGTSLISPLYKGLCSENGIRRTRVCRQKPILGGLILIESPGPSALARITTGMTTEKSYYFPEGTFYVFLLKNYY